MCFHAFAAAAALLIPCSLQPLPPQPRSSQPEPAAEPLPSRAKAQDGHSPSAVLLRTPDVSETQVVFAYAGDLWLCPREGGEASRLTSATGAERLPKFSPDGREVAFMADYDGGSDIYVIGTNGGAPRRVTFHPGRETLAEWHPDGSKLLFFSSEESGIARAPRIFTTDAAGGSHPAPLGVPYGTFGSLDPAGAEWLAYTPLTREGRTWRRYRGGMAQDIWLFNLNSGESRRVTDDPGTDRLPMWHGAKLVFQSDRGPKGIANLYEYDPESGETRALTSLATSGARFPSIGPKDVVFEQAGGLFRFDLETEDIVRVDVSIPGDRPAVRTQTLELKDRVSNHSISKSGKRLAIEARGEIFSVPVEDGVTRNLTRTSGVAERWPGLSPDGRFVAYWSDRTGEYELFIRHADGSTFDGADVNGERQLTRTGGDWKERPVWSPDGAKIAWSNHDGQISFVTVETGLDSPHVDIAKVAFPRYVEIEWSPDSRWLAWSAQSSQSKLDAIWLYELGENSAGVVHEVTSGLFDDSEPEFSLCGDWLFFHSGRAFEPTYAELDSTWIYRDTRALMAMPLNEDVEIPWAPKNVEEDTPGSDEDSGEDEDEGEDEPEDGDSADNASEDGASEDGNSEDGDSAGGDSKSGDSEKDEDKEANEEPEPLTIDVDTLEQRAVRLPIEAGIRGGLVGLDNAVLFAREENDKMGIYHYDLGDHEEDPSVVAAPISGYGLSPDGSKLMVLSKGGDVHVVTPEPGQSLDEPVSFDQVRGRFEPRAEWAQMIRDVHRLYRDWFYDEGMHGVDWDGLRDRMLSTLKDATSREDVHFLIGEMLAELNVGHAYNRPPAGGFEREETALRAGLLGADWRPSDAPAGFQLERLIDSVLEVDGRSPLRGLAEPGDVLTAIDGFEIDPAKSLHEAMLGTSGRDVLLTFDRAGETREVVARTIRSERALRYRDWVAKKRAAVHAATNGAVGYVHVPSTGLDGQTELYRQFLAERTRKALIIDERWNSGGQIPTRFIELLARRPTNAWALRDGKVFEWPEVYHDGPKVMLINHSAGSGGDAFPWYFRRFGLGKLIGTRTWGGLVGISGNPALIDGASPSVPTFGFFELDGTWGVEGHGVDPDIEVIDDPGQMRAGEDPQLARAIAELETEMETWGYAATARPASPNRAGAGLPDSDR